MKTIRLSVSDIRDAPLNTSIDTKVVLLIRDPRASLTSIWASPRSWEKRFYSPNITCLKLLSNVRDYRSHIIKKFDQETLKRNPPIKLIRFEDLVENRDKVVKDLFQFLNLSSFSSFVLQKIKKQGISKKSTKNQLISRIRVNNAVAQRNTGGLEQKIQEASKDPKQSNSFHFIIAYRVARLNTELIKLVLNFRAGSCQNKTAPKS